MTTGTEACTLSSAEPVGTTSTEALACNSYTLDRIMNGDDISYNNRIGNPLRSFSGVYEQIDEILSNSEGVPLGDGVYATGRTYTTVYQYLTQNNIEYRVNDRSLLPYTTTETNASDDSNLSPFTGVSNLRLTGAVQSLIREGAVIFPTTVGVSMENGDTVPVGTTHVQVDVGSVTEIVSLSSAVVTSGVVSDLEESGCTIGAVDFFFNTIALKNTHSTKERLASLISSGGLVLSVLGDSTEAGVGAGGGAYAQTTQERLNGWANLSTYYMMINDPAFIRLDPDIRRISQPFQANVGEVTNTLSLPYPSWQVTAADNPTISYSCNNTTRILGQEFTVYVNERTSDAALAFTMTITDATSGASLYSGEVDTYVTQETFGTVGSFPVGGRLGTRTITMSATARRINVTLSNFVTKDRGNGQAANGTCGIYGFTFGQGTEFHNLSVSSTTLNNNSARNQLRGVTTTERLTLAQSFNSNAYIIGWGTNDSRIEGYTPDNFRDEYQQLIDNIRADNADSIIILSTDPRGIGDPYLNNPAYNNVIRNLAETNNLPVFDVEKLSDTLPSAFYADTVHPSDTGVYQIAHAFCNQFGIEAKELAIVEPPSSGADAVAGEFVITTGTSIPTTTTEIFTTTINRNPSATRLIISGNGVIQGTATDSHINTTLTLKVNGTSVDAKRVATDDASGVPRLSINMKSVFTFGASETYVISVDAVDNTSDGVTVIGERTTVDYLWV